MARAQISWAPRFRSPALEKYRIYAGPDADGKGEFLAEVPASEMVHAVDVEEGEWFFRVVGVMRGGVEEAWQNAEVARSFVTGCNSAPAAPQNVAIEQVDPSVGFRVAIDCPERTDEPFIVQVIEGGATPDLGKLITEFQVNPAGPLPPDGSRYYSPLLALEGTAPPGSVRTLHVRTMGVHGMPGGYVTRSVVVPDRPGFGAGISIATLDPTTPTYTGIPAPSTSTPYGIVATDGLRLREFPDVSASWSALGTCESGLFASNRHFAPYVDNARIEFDEIDLGADTYYVLEIYDEIQRKSGSAAWAALLVSEMNILPSLFPMETEATRDGSGAAGRQAWMFREIGVDGSPRQPLRHCKWQFVIGSSAGVAHAEADYVDYVPGAWVKGRYVRLCLVLEEPTGWHQIICPRITAQARPVLSTSIANGTPEGAVIGAPGKMHVRPDGPPFVYAKTSGVGTSGWVPAVEGYAGPPLLVPPGLYPANATDVTSLTSPDAVAVYLGRAMKANPTVVVHAEVATACATITWAEVAVCKGAFVLSGAAALSRVGSASVAAVYNATGLKQVSIATSGVVAGDELWAVFASFATTPFQLRACMADQIQSGVFQTAAGTRPSTMSVPKTFALGGASVAPPRIVAVQS